MTTTSIPRAIRRLRESLLVRGEAGLPDGQLLECFLADRDEGAFAALVRRHGPMVLGVCGRILRNAHDAEDAFQATFLVLARKAASVIPRDLVGHWLYGVAYRTALRARSSTFRRRYRERQVNDMPERAAPVEAVGDDLRPVLDEELNRLPEIYRVPLVLCELEGKTKREVASALGVPEGTVSSRLARGRVLLRKNLNRRGLAVAVGSLTFALSQNASAGVPPALLASTVRAASEVAAIKTATAGLASARVVALSEGEITHMLLTKLKVFSWVLVALLAAGVVVAQALRAENTSASESARPLSKPQGKVGEANLAGPGEARPGGEKRKAKLFPLPAGTTVDAICWGHDGKTLVTLEHTVEEMGGKIKLTGFALRVRDARTGEVRKTLLKTDGSLDSVMDATFSPDGKSLAAIHRAGGETAVLVWDSATWKGTKTLTAEGLGLLYKVAWSRDGRVLAAAGSPGVNRGGEIVVWDAKTEKLFWHKQEQVHGETIYGLAFSPDGKLLASASRDATIKLWDAATGEGKKTLEGHGGEGVFSVAFSQDGLLASGGLDGTVRLWDLEAGKPKQTLKSGSSKGRVEVAFSPNGRLLASTGIAGKRSGVTLFDARTGKLTRTFPQEKGHPQAIAFSPDGATIAVGCSESPILLLPVDD